MTTFKCACGREYEMIEKLPVASTAGPLPTMTVPSAGEPDRDWHASEKQIAFAKKIAAALHHEPIPDFNNMTWRNVGDYIRQYKSAFYATPESKEGAHA